jgi:tRNA (Thr-GGU) A37 N-methylase
MSSVNAIRTILERVGFSEAAATYFKGICGIDSLDEIAYLDGIEDVDVTVKGVTNPGGTVTTGTGTTRVTSRNNGIPVSIRAMDNLKLCVYYLKHIERVQRQPVVNAINLVLVCSYRDQQRHEVGLKKTAEEPEINDKYWPRTLEKIKEYLASQYGVTGATLDYVVRPNIAFKPEAEDPAKNYETVDQEMTARAPHTGRSFMDDRRKV